MSRLIEHFKSKILFPLGVNFYLDKEDRRVLEKIIFPWLRSREDLRNILFVGCESYTRGYGRLLSGKDYQTIEIDPAKARFGARRHVTDSMANLNRHYTTGSLDVVLCNGVLGWGLDDPGEAREAIEGAWDALRSGGLLILGWNDIPERRPFDIRAFPSLTRFAPFTFPPLDASEYLTATDNRHTYNFYLKP